jgi:hypothetical protein
MIKQQSLVVTFINVLTRFTNLCFFKVYEELRFSNFPLYPRGRALGNFFRLKDHKIEINIPICKL